MKIPEYMQPGKEGDPIRTVFTLADSLLEVYHNRYVMVRSHIADIDMGRNRGSIDAQFVALDRPQLQRGAPSYSTSIFCLFERYPDDESNAQEVTNSFLISTDQFGRPIYYATEATDDMEEIGEFMDDIYNGRNPQSHVLDRMKIMDQGQIGSVTNFLYTNFRDRLSPFSRDPMTHESKSELIGRYISEIASTELSYFIRYQAPSGAVELRYDQDIASGEATQILLQKKPHFDYREPPYQNRYEERLQTQFWEFSPTSVNYRHGHGVRSNHPSFSIPEISLGDVSPEIFDPQNIAGALELMRAGILTQN